MTDLDFEAIERRKMVKGMKQLNKRCHCGKMKVNHTVQEANICKKSQGVDTVVTRMTEKQIQQADFRKI